MLLYVGISTYQKHFLPNLKYIKHLSEFFHPIYKKQCIGKQNITPNKKYRLQ